jgi:hypothetical protein
VEPGGPTARNDPEFENPVGPAVRLRDPLVSPETYLRLVANPFLAILGFIVWLLAIRWVTHLNIERELLAPLAPIIVIVLLAAVWRVGSLFQYHCLDCGATGRMAHWREHLCPASAYRRDSGRGRRIRGPSLHVQIVLWLWGLLAFGIFANAQGWLGIAR